MALGFPSDRQMLEAIRQFLKEEVQPAITDPAVAYRLKVAANSLSIVARECEQSAALAQLEQTRYSQLLSVQGEAEALNRHMAAALRDGELDATAPEVLAALKEIALAKMAIDNPRYSSYQALASSAAESGRQ